MKFNTKEALIEKVKTIINHKVGDYDTSKVFSETNSKGKIGHITEKGFFGYEINSSPKPDFENLDIELKSTGYIWVKKGQKVSAKERLVLSKINYKEDIKVDFYHSHVYRKLANILLVLYEYEKGKNPSDFVYTNYFMYEYSKISEKDKMIIENDWNAIIGKIKQGKAHELSESDTYYLGACTKGANKHSVTTQPYSDIKAMSRAYSLKNSYMTELFRTKIFNEFESKEAFIKSIGELKSKTFEEIINDTFESYKGLSLTDIDVLLDEPVQRVNNKQYIRSYVSRMMHVQQQHLNSLEEFNKANIRIKTIRISKKGTIKEHMSFPTFDFEEVANETWESAEIRDMFATTKFLFVVFREINDLQQEYEFVGVTMWNMPFGDLETKIKRVWEHTHEILNGELVLSVKANTVRNNFIKATDNLISHVRPHAKDRTVTNQLPLSTKLIIESNDGSVDLSYLDNHRFTKQCFWLNSEYILMIIKNANLV